jgi:deoxyribodipyrimidine photolyase
MQKVIHRFRQDLRLNDNPALFDAASCGKILPVCRVAPRIRLCPFVYMVFSIQAERLSTASIVIDFPLLKSRKYQ